MRRFLMLLPILLGACMLVQCTVFQPPKREAKGITPKDWISRHDARLQLDQLQGGVLFSHPVADGAVLTGFRHIPKGKRLGVVLLLHGLQTHSGWMTPMAREIAQAGYEVWCPDRRGSGTNAAGHYASGDLADWRIWVADIRALVSHLVLVRPDAPIHLVGYSWGGVTSAIYLAEQPDPKIRKAVFLAPGWATRDQPGKIGTLTLLGVSALLPQLRIYIPTPPEVATSAQWRSILWEDEALLRNVSLRYLRQMSGAQSAALRSLDQIEVDCAVLLGEADRLVDNESVTCLASKLRNQASPIAYLPMQGHLMIVESPKATARKITELLRK